MHTLLICHLYLILSTSTVVTAAYLLDQLIQDVMTDYEPAARPSCHDVSPTRVTIDMALRQIVELDEPHQFLNTIVWMRLAWNDCRLQWNASKYEGIDYVTLPNKKVWLPDVTLYDNAENSLSGMDGGYNLVVTNNGDVRFNFPSVIRSLCAVDVNHFPFDYQACKLKFGSWAYPGADVDIWNSSDAVDLSSFVLNTEWVVDSAPIFRIEKTFGTDVYATVNCILKLKRRPLFYGMNLIFPCCLISFLAILGFILSPTAGEKVNLEITVLLSLSVFQLIVLELMPPSGDSVSFIGLYFLVSMTLVGLSCLATVIVLNVHFHGQTGVPVPDWARRFIRGPVSRLLCIDTKHLLTGQCKQHSDNERQCDIISCNHLSTIDVTFSKLESKIEQNGRHISREINGNGVANGQSVQHEQQAQSFVNGEHNANKGNDQDVYMVSLMEQIRDNLAGIEELLRAQKANEDCSDWYVLARMLDRMFMITYVVFLFTSGLTLCLQYVGHVETPPLWDQYM